MCFRVSVRTIRSTLSAISSMCVNLTSRNPRTFHVSKRIALRACNEVFCAVAANVGVPGNVMVKGLGRRRDQDAQLH